MSLTQQILPLTDVGNVLICRNGVPSSPINRQLFIEEATIIYPSDTACCTKYGIAPLRVPVRLNSTVFAGYSAISTQLSRLAVVQPLANHPLLIVPVCLYQLKNIPQIIHHRFQLRDRLGRQVLRFGQIVGVFERFVLEPGDVELVVPLLDLADVELAEAALLALVLALGSGRWGRCRSSSRTRRNVPGVSGRSFLVMPGTLERASKIQTFSVG